MEQLEGDARSLAADYMAGKCLTGKPRSLDPMPMDAREIESLIKAALPDAEVEIKDLAGDGDHYAATVTSAAFKGKSRVQQHQMVYAALQGRMGGVLHALALTTGHPTIDDDEPGALTAAEQEHTMSRRPSDRSTTK